jgi:hypothetical protein
VHSPCVSLDPHGRKCRTRPPITRDPPDALRLLASLYVARVRVGRVDLPGWYLRRLKSLRWVTQASAPFVAWLRPVVSYASFAARSTSSFTSDSTNPASGPPVANRAGLVASGTAAHDHNREVLGHDRTGLAPRTSASRDILARWDGRDHEATSTHASFVGWPEL